MCLCDKKVLDESLLICNLMIFMYVVTALFTVDNGLSTTVVKQVTAPSGYTSTTVVEQVTAPSGYTVETSSRGDDPWLKELPVRHQLSNSLPTSFIQLKKLLVL